MARTRSVATLKQLAQAVRAARLDRAALEDAYERVLHSRRDFLRVAGFGGAAAWLSACGGSGGPAPARDERVVIVGAGMAGLHAAYRLSQMGVRAAVFEGAGRVAGRMHSDTTTFGPQVAELGAEFIDSVHTTIRGLAAELGLTVDDLHQDARGDVPLFYVGGRRVQLDELLQGVVPLVTAVDAALASLDDPAATISYTNPNGAGPIDALSAAEWLDTARIGGDVRAVLESGLIAEYGLDPDQQSALDVVLTFAPGEVSDQRWRVRGGNDQIPTALAARLDPAQLELDARLEAIREQSDGRYRLSFARGSGRLDVTADHVVLAIPFTLLRQVKLDVPLSDVKRRAIDELGYGTNAKLVSGYSARPWSAAGENGTAVTDLDAAVIWDATRGQPGTSGVLTSFRGGHRGVDLGRGSTADQLRGFLAEVEQVFPGVSARSTGAAVRFHWPSYPFTKGSYSAYKVGQYTSIAGAEIERAGNLHFCGEHTSRAFQGFMEGAAETGAAAAAEVAADLGIARATGPGGSTSSQQRRGICFESR